METTMDMSLPLKLVPCWEAMKKMVMQHNVPPDNMENMYGLLNKKRKYSSEPANIGIQQNSVIGIGSSPT